ncbi:hypothetical protein WKV44_04885 [Spirochaetia bacterium 38H-sp]|uniref:Uncharacterized protein n=1 Tax=Rarispira pelagica TaxID=3141764 RepID=A0ABU9UB36_9SPIR
MRELLSKILGEEPRYLWIAAGALIAIPFCIWLGFIILSEKSTAVENTDEAIVLQDSSPYADFFSVDTLIIPDIWQELSSIRHVKVRNVGDVWSQKEASRWWSAVIDMHQEKDYALDKDIEKLLENIR